MILQQLPPQTIVANIVSCRLQDLLQEYPVLRKDKGMMGGYMFVMDFLETVTAETSKVVGKQQR